MLAPGTLLQKRYQIVRLIGKGGMGAVYEAIDQRLNVAVALKQTTVGGTQFDAAFKREARLLATLRHPALPVVSDYFGEDDQHFLVMQLIHGVDLAALLAEHGAPLASDEVLRWADQVLDALEYLHSQKSPIIHRDIKPQNLKLTPEGAIVLLDFGLARGAVVDRSDTEPLQSLYGFTPRYAPLEQIRGDGTSPRSDLYALAATLYHLLTNVKPPDALQRASAVLEGQADPLRPAHLINPHVLPSVSALLHAGLALDPMQRPGSASEMRVLLHQALADQPTSVAEQPTLSAAAASIEPPKRPLVSAPPGDHPNNLPIQLTTLIGRERESAAIQQLLQRDGVRLLTLIGPGGMGKTRLSLQVAADLLDRFADGVFFVSLAAIRDPDLVIPTIAQALGVKDSGAQPLFETLAAYLRDKHMLVVLDNFEQVSAAAPLIAALLAAPRIKMLATSREILRISGEHTFAVPPLGLPEPRHGASAEQIAHYDAVRLFVTRAEAARPDFQVTNANAATVAEICRRLDGLPLAIELAAARIRMLNPQALLDRLSSRLMLLAGGARDLPARQQTIRNTIDWSYNLLDAGEQLLFRRLAVFVGGRTLEAAEAVCQDGGDLALDTFEGMASLLDKSLLYQADGLDGTPRFMMLETIWEYARERLAASGELAALQQAHTAYYLALVRQAGTGLRSADQRMWLERLDAEHDNIRAVLRGDIDQGDGAVALELVGILWFFWDRRSHLSEGLRWTNEALARGAEAATHLRAQALHAAGNLTHNQGNYRRASELYEQALALRPPEDTRGIAASLHGIGNSAYDLGDYARAIATIERCLDMFRRLGERATIALELMVLGEIAYCQSNYARAETLLTESKTLYGELGDTWGVGMALTTMGQVADEQGNYDQARARLEEGFGLLRGLGNRRGMGLALNYLAVIALHCGDTARAAALSEESLAILRELDEQWGAAKALDNLGVVALRQGDIARAMARCEESLALYRSTGDRRGIALALHSVGRAAAEQGAYTRARDLLGESLAILLELGVQLGLVMALETFADVALKQHQAKQAARLLGAAATLRTKIGAAIPLADQDAREQIWSELCFQLGAEAATAVWQQGQALPIEQAVAEALQSQGSPGC